MVRTTLIEAIIDAPPIVEVSSRVKTVSITVRTELRNVGEQDYVLYAPDQDSQHFWHVLDANHREVLREQPRKTVKKKKHAWHPARSQTITTSHAAHETVTLKLNAAKLKDGQTYTIRSENWGQIAETTFVVIRHQKRPVKKKTGPVKKKKPTKIKKVAKKLLKKPVRKAKY